MKDKYIFRRCSISDNIEISILVNKVLETTKNSDYWKWKYFKNSAGDALSALVLFDGKVVGQLGAIPVRFLLKGREFVGAQELDVAIIEDHRKFDTFFTMVALGKEILLKENIDFKYSFTNELTSEITNILSPDRKISSIPRLVKVLDIKPFLEERFGVMVFSKILSHIMNSILRLRYPQKVVVPDGMQIKQITQFDKRFDTLWDQIKEDYPITTVRDSLYLNWRYADATHMNYETFILEETGSKDILGFIILGESGGGIPVGQIFDIVTPRNSESRIASCLVNFAVKRFCKRKVAAVRCWMFPHSHIYPELAKIGFLRREKKGRDFVFQSINLKVPAISQDFLENSKNWYLTKGDSDID